MEGPVAVRSIDFSTDMENPLVGQQGGNPSGRVVPYSFFAPRGETNVGVRWQPTWGRPRDICLRYALLKTSLEIASHQRVAEIWSSDSCAGPDIQ